MRADIVRTPYRARGILTRKETSQSRRRALKEKCHRREIRFSQRGREMKEDQVTFDTLSYRDVFFMTIKRLMRLSNVTAAEKKRDGVNENVSR